MSVVFPLSRPYVSLILQFVRCQSQLLLPVTNLKPNILFTSSMSFCGSLPACDPKNLGGFILTKSQNFGCHYSVISFSRIQNLLIILVGHTRSQKMNWCSEILHLNFLIQYQRNYVSIEFISIPCISSTRRNDLKNTTSSQNGI